MTKLTMKQCLSYLDTLMEGFNPFDSKGIHRRLRQLNHKFNVASHGIEDKRMSHESPTRTSKIVVASKTLNSPDQNITDTNTQKDNKPSRHHRPMPMLGKPETQGRVVAASKYVNVRPG